MRFQFPLFVAAITVAAESMFSYAQKIGSKVSKKKPPLQPPAYSREDMMRLFHILSTAEDYIVGAATTGDISIRNSNNKPTNFNGFLPQNVQRCTEALTSETMRLDPYNLTGIGLEDGVLLPDKVLPGSFYKDLNYTSDSFYANSMDHTVSRLTHVLEQLHEENFVNVVGDGHPMIMFDIDNTISYSAFNDTDHTGETLPIRETVQFVHQWCNGWGSGNDAIFDCFFITARWCSAKKAANAESFMRRHFPAAPNHLIDSNIMMTGALSCACCADGFHNSWKDILRCKLEDKTGGKFVASIGDQYTDSAGPCSGLRVKLPNVWFDSSVVSDNLQYQQDIFSQLPIKQCSVDRAFGAAQKNTTVESCLTNTARERAVEFSKLGFCKSLTQANNVPNQRWGCVKEISNIASYDNNNSKGTTTPKETPRKDINFTCCFNATDSVGNSCF